MSGPSNELEKVMKNMTLEKHKIMKRVIILALMIGTAALLASCASRNHEAAQTAAKQPTYAGPPPGTGQASMAWPVRFDDESGTSFTIFEPDCDSWDGHQLPARSAVAIQALHEPLATYGVFAFD